MAAWMLIALNCFKYGGITLAWLFGIAGIIASYLEQKRRITGWGWLLIILTSVSALVGLGGVTAEIFDKQQEASDQAKKTLAMLHEIRRSQQPLRTILVDVEAQAPDNGHLDKVMAADMDRYRSRLDQDYKTEKGKEETEKGKEEVKHRWFELAKSQAEPGSPLKWINDRSSADLYGVPLSWRYTFIDPQSPLFPNIDKEFLSYELLSNLTTTFWFFKGDKSIADSDSVPLLENDLQFSCYLSNNDTNNRPALAYDIETAKTFTLSGRNIVASSESWASNGMIISVEDLLGVRMLVRSYTSSGPHENAPIVFKPKRIHFRIADREVYISGQQFTPVVADDGTAAYSYTFPPSEEGFGKLRQTPMEASGK